MEDIKEKAKKKTINGHIWYCIGSPCTRRTRFFDFLFSRRWEKVTWSPAVK